MTAPAPLIPSDIGVNVVGYMEAESGTGEIARSLIESLRAAGISYSVIVNRLSFSRQSDVHSRAHNSRLYDVNIICANADELPRIASRLGSLMRGRYTIGVWAWEVDRFPPAMAASAALVNEVWAISHYTAQAVSDSIDKPVYVFPLAVSPTRVSSLGREALGLPDGFVFLFCFDYLSVFERKNPIGVVRAFCKAFPREGRGPSLVIKAVNGEHSPEHQGRLRRAVQDRKDIILMERYLSRAEQDALIQHCGAYVSLHRSEGYGLTMAEAMLRGKPVIATGYSGNLEFMNAANSWLVPYELVHVSAGCDPYPEEARWADPSYEDAAAAMREVYEGSDTVAERASRGRDTIGRFHTPMARQSFLAARLSDAHMAIHTPAKPDAERQAHPVPRFAATLAARATVWMAERRLRADYPVGRVGSPQSAYRMMLGAAIRTVGRARGLNDIPARLDDLKVRLDVFESELSAEPYKAKPDDLTITGREGRRTLGYDDAFTSKDRTHTYADFEDIFRGTEETIRARLGWYGPLFVGCDPIVDLGCGRGEFLDVAAANGIRATGIEIDAGMVERAQKRGRSVISADAVVYLENAPEGSLGGIFSAQFIEHLAPDQLRRMLAAGWRALRPGGLLVAETVNPHSPMAAKTFWLDFTHERPIFPEALLFLCRDAGFSKGEIVFPNGTGDLQRDRRYEGEYAVIATKA